MPLNLPSAYPGNPSGYVTYYKAQADNYSMSAVYARNPLESQTTLNWEMSSMLANCSRSIATKVYVADTGAWSTAANWFPTGVPVAGDNVLIGEGVSVTYDVDAPTTSLTYVRLDGTLQHPNNASTAMNVDTIFITPTGKHQIASPTAPLSASRTCRIIFSSSTDMNASVDTALQTKGIVSAGTRAYYGAAKTSRLKVASNAGPGAGAMGVVLEAQPTGWRVGDRVTISGTMFRGYDRGSYGNPDRAEETRTITSIGLTGTVSLNSALAYGHTAPSSSLVAANTMRAYVANLTRNIQFLTENGSTALRHRRAHDMQMHYPTYQARWVEWRDMGRTHKGYRWAGVAGYNQQISTATAGPTGSLAVNGTVSLGTEAVLEISNNGYDSTIAQTLFIDGFDRSGTAKSETVQLTSYYVGSIPGGNWTRITSLRLGTAGAFCPINVNHRSRLISSLGIINRNGSGNNPVGWTYEAPYREANIQGRYPVHFHKCGIIGDVWTSPPQMLGCVMSGSPGWGFVHHLSHLNWIECIAHDFEGAGFVAEAGNETGLWKDCHATRGWGIPNSTHKGESDVGQVDPGRQAGYWFTGRMIKVIGCVATDVEVAYHYNVRFSQTNLVTEQVDHPRSLNGQYNPTIDESPIIHFKDNESIACANGFFLTKASQFQSHDIRTLLGPHLSWSCPVGFKVEYTQHYTYNRLTLVTGTRISTDQTAPVGFQLGANISDQVFVDLKVDGSNDAFYGIDLQHENANDNLIASLTANGRVLIDAQIINVPATYLGPSTPIKDFISYADQLVSSLSLTVTTSISISTTAVGTRRFVTFFPSLSVRDDNVQEFGQSGWRISGQKIDRLSAAINPKLNFYPGGISAARQRDYPRMYGGGGNNGWQQNFNYISRFGIYLDAVIGYTMHLPVYIGDRVTGGLDMRMVPATLVSTADTNALYVPTYVRGNADYTQTTPPTIQNHRVSTSLNVNVNVNLLNGATHPLGTSMYVCGIDRPFNCHVVDNNNGTITIVPPINYQGTETFSYWVADNNANVTKASVIVEVLPASGATGRSGVNDFIASQYNTPSSVNVLANDIGDSKALLTATVVGGPAVGTASISTGGVIVFTPSSSFATTITQTAEIQYTFTASGGSAGASLFVTVNPAPATGRTGVNDFAATQNNTLVSVNVLANDIGDNKSLVAATVSGGVAVGGLTLLGGTTIAFVPTATFAAAATATATVTYRFTASGGSAGATLFVTVNPLPATGRAGVPDFASTLNNTPVSVNVLSNDIGDNKVLLTATVVGGNATGTASISTGGIIVFTPSSTFASAVTATATVNYTFTASGGSAGAALLITVNPPPTGRQGVADFASTSFDAAVSVNVLANDIGDLKVLQTAVVVGGAAVGTALIDSGIRIIFTPAAGYVTSITQTAEIQYTFTASGGSAGASLFVTVVPRITGRAGVADFASTSYNTAVSTNVLANDIGDSKSLQTAVVVGGAAVGTASISTGGIIVFTPTSTFASAITATAEVQYTFTASGGSAGASLFITVNPPPPTGRAGVSDFNSTTYNVAVSTNVLANDIGDSKLLQTAVVVGGNAVGTASISTGGIIVFTPTSTFAVTITQVAEIQYTFTASGGSAGASLFITVNAGPPLPTGAPDFTSTTYNTAVALAVLNNDSGGTVKTLLTATVVGGNAVGTASISTGGIIVFTPTSTFATTLTQVAEVQYTYTTTGGSSGASMFVTVNAGPSLPPVVTPTAPVATDGTAQAYVGRSNGTFIFRQAFDTNAGGSIQLNQAFRIDGPQGTIDIDPGGILYITPQSAGIMRVNYRVVNNAALTATGIMTIFCVEAPRIGNSDGGSAPMLGAPVSWSRKSVSNIKSVAKAISAVFADLDPNDPIKLAERMVRKYTFAEVKKLIGTSDFESLLDMELQELIDEMERMKNGD